MCNQRNEPNQRVEEILAGASAALSKRPDPGWLVAARGGCEDAPK
jgi:hypothetical protein